MRRRVSRFHSDRLPRRPQREKQEEVTRSAGALPEIRLEGDSVVFYLDILPEIDSAAPASGPSRLVLRCTPDGNVWAAAEGEV
jgi:hypothetical protein